MIENPAHSAFSHPIRNESPSVAKHKVGSVFFVIQVQQRLADCLSSAGKVALYIGIPFFVEILFTGNKLDRIVSEILENDVPEKYN